jgi:hypothetical protein
MSHLTNLHNNLRQCALQVSETVVLVRTINIYPQTVLLGDDDNRLELIGQSSGFLITTLCYFWLDFQFLGPHDCPFDVIQREFKLHHVRRI